MSEVLNKIQEILYKILSVIDPPTLSTHMGGTRAFCSSLGVLFKIVHFCRQLHGNFASRFACIYTCTRDISVHVYSRMHVAKEISIVMSSSTMQVQETKMEQKSTLSPYSLLIIARHCIKHQL